MNTSNVVPTLLADFAADLISIARTSLTRDWPNDDVGAIKDKDVLSYHFEAFRKRLSVCKRKVLTSDAFHCPLAYVSGWESLKGKIIEGKDFGPHLSIRHGSLMNQDGLLDEWGVCHFHLGLNPHPKKHGYLERTPALVLAMVTDKVFYAIGVFNHVVQPWSNTEVFETLHRNWPYEISRWQLKGVYPENLTPQQRLNIRKGGQAATGTSDGTTYGSVGGCTGATGLKYESIRQADMLTSYVDALQEALTKNLHLVVPYLEQNGYVGQEQVEARLMVVENGYRAFFPQYRVAATLTFEVIDKESI